MRPDPRFARFLRRAEGVLPLGRRWLGRLVVEVVVAGLLAGSSSGRRRRRGQWLMLAGSAGTALRGAGTRVWLSIFEEWSLGPIFWP